MKLSKNIVGSSFERNSALFVVAHGLWQKSRGRNPSMPYYNGYDNFLNPKQAFAIALQEVKNPEALCGTSISRYADTMTLGAKLIAEPVHGEFNGVDLTVTENMSAEGIVAYFHAEIEKRSEEYRNSPEGIAAKLKREQEIVEKQARCDELVLQLESETFEFGNLPVLLDWLCAMQDVSDDIGTKVNVDKVVQIFATHGYIAGMNCEDDFNENDPHNWVGWLVGQALDGLLKIGAIHQVVHHFTKQWKEKFECMLDENGRIVVR